MARALLRAQVSWHRHCQGAEAGRLTAAISGLRDDHGDPLTYAETGGTRRRFVDRVKIAYVVILADSGRVRFAEDGQSPATVSFHDRRGPATPDGASIVGNFVGNSKDGPLAAIGLWTLEAGGRLGNSGRTRGAFGAELVP